MVILDTVYSCFTNVSCDVLAFVREVAGLSFEACPIKSNVGGSLAEKKVAHLISRHGPEFVLCFTLSSLFLSMYLLLFLQTEGLPVAQTICSMNL